MKYVSIFSLFFLLTVVDALATNINAEKSISQKVIINDDGSFVVEMVEETTVLNKNGVKYATAFFRYGDLYEVKNLKAEIEANGDVDKVKSREFLDVSADFGGNITGERIIYYRPAYPIYPYTVRYEYKIECSSLFFLEFFGAWSPAHSEEVRVSNYSYELFTNENFKLEKRYRGDKSLYQIEEKPEKIAITLKNYVAETEKEYAVPGLDQGPGFIPQPKNFIFEQSDVNMSSWKDYGNWFYKLNEGRDELPENQVAKVKELVKNAGTDLEKISILYDYLQNTTRYVSIQLGIGGWQSMTAESVATKGYGDCKGLSTYMKGMLDIAGIKSNYVLAGATYGKMHQPFLEETPENNFNHVFLVVPMEKDTVWLECTSSNTNMNYTGFHIGNRTALFVEEDGSKLIKTPSFTYEDNSEELDVVYDLSGDQQTFVVNKIVRGNKALIERLHNDYKLEFQDFKKRYKKQLPFQVSKLNEFEIEQFDEINPTFRITLKGQSNGLMASAGNNRVIKPLEICKLNQRIEVDQDYNKKFHINTRQQEISKIKLILPDEYTVAELPGETTIESSAGSYLLKYELKEGALIISRKIKFSGKVFSPDEVDVVNEFYEKVHKSDNKALILVNNKKS
ncbi:transglutaminase domain-containing protein [Mangrovivirga cuniculi]|uniref:Transglutaminase-like domain-containing protein n=1 Tax=Mangrovivirga cuniculi TaxID=2715131 RepID=A0A4D7K860_9BACT|nr:transglutaminase domain-containing protein [Mangrovivirga cuniculi]QCK15498.1 hypothetical protein DCC35_12465 [Mangrovivirga cuniculi]